MDLQAVKAEIIRQYPYRIELHAHTAPVSGCSEVSPTEMVEMYAALGFEAVAVTNHLQYRYDKETKEAYIERYMAAYEEAKAAGEACGVRVYLGAEIRFTENNNDYLVFGIDRQQLLDMYDYLPRGLEYFRRHYPMPNVVFIQAHPMRDGNVRVDPALLDGVEVFNMHPNHNSRVGLASLFAQEKENMIVTAGSDFHHPNREHEGQGVIRAASLPEDTVALAELLKSGAFVIEIARGYLVI